MECVVEEWYLEASSGKMLNTLSKSKVKLKKKRNREMVPR
jgi:hypothetical protein